MSTLAESTVEGAALFWFADLGYAVLHGPDIAPGELLAERTSHSDVMLVNRLRSALERINPKISDEAREEAIRKVLRSEHPSLVDNNHRSHRFLFDGVPVEYRAGGRTIYDQVWLIDFSRPDKNDWLVVNQFTVVEDRHNRRPDASVRAKLRTLVKRILRKYGYPPDKQEKATQTVLEQAELLCRAWAA